jgi:cobalt-zinc-cadmium efflux system membrane fusion protein
MKHRIGTLLLSLVLVLAAPIHADEHDHPSHDEHEHGHGDGHEDSGVRLTLEALEKYGVTSATAGPGTIHSFLELNGRVGANQDRVAHIHPRFAGIAKEVFKQSGDTVQKGETLALIESNQSLQRYEVTSLIQGTVLFRHATVGEYVTESEPIFVVADLDTVWIDLFVYPKDYGKVRAGQKVRFNVPYSDSVVESTI